MSRRPAKNIAKRSGAEVREVGRKPSRLTSEVVDISAVFAEPSFNPTNLMEAVVERSNMIKALVQVERNKGAPGVDGLSVGDLRSYLVLHWGEIKQWLLSGEYRPRPVRRVEIPKPDGGVRELGIPTCLDRMIQQAIGQVLGPIFEPTFSESSYGFRPKRSAQQAVARAKSYVSEGKRIVVDLDLEKFFDRVNHDILMERLSRRIKDKRMLKIIRRFLEAGVMIGGLEEPRTEGTPQGGPLSPLLSNVLLDELDKELERRGLSFCRYADDCNVYVRSRKAGERVKASVTRWLAECLRLSVNDAKSASDLVSRRKFLGYTMIVYRRYQPKLKPAVKSLERFKGKIRSLFRKGRGRNLKSFIIKDLNPVVRGWAEYYKLSNVTDVFTDLDGWIRRKLRCMIWRQWKRPRTRYRKLLALGVSEARARTSAFSGRGPWWQAAQGQMTIPFSTKYFDQLGLIRIATRIGRMATAS